MWKWRERIFCRNPAYQPMTMEDLGFTSFDFMSMLGEIEDRFDVEVDQEEAADIRTVQEAVEYLESIA